MKCSYLFAQKEKKSLRLMASVLEAWVNTWEISSVILSSRDFRLIRDGPSDRRKWLDLLLSASSVSYFNFLQGYTELCWQEMFY